MKRFAAAALAGLLLAGSVSTAAQAAPLRKATVTTGKISTSLEKERSVTFEKERSVTMEKER